MKGDKDPGYGSTSKMIAETALALAADDSIAGGVWTPGAAIGLPLAKQFVEAHGGTISLVSEPGQGTLITVELPRG